MSPTARLDNWGPLRDHDDPVLLRVTPRHPHPLHNTELSKSHSVDALHHRLEERTAHSVEVLGKLSYDLSKKLQASEVQQQQRVARSENNNNLESGQIVVDNDRKERDRISPQSIEVLNDRNRQLERERRKLAASCEPVSSRRTGTNNHEILLGSETNFQRERSATIEMTSRNVELLNRRNAVNEKRASGTDINLDTRPPPVIEKPPPPTTSPPRTPDLDRRHKAGAVPRRSGSCSSSSSSSLKSLDIRNSSTLPSRTSPSKTSTPTVSPTRTEPPTSPCESCNFVEHISISTRRKVSSPTQTDDTGSSPVDNATSNYTKSSQTCSGSESPMSPSSPTPSLSRNDGKSSASNSPCVSPQPGIEGLTLVQRTEIVLRVNAATSDAASQTELLSTSEEQETEKQSLEINPEPRKKLPEEIECEELSRDLASQLNPNDKLVTILGKFDLIFVSHFPKIEQS